MIEFFGDCKSAKIALNNVGTLQKDVVLKEVKDCVKESYFVAYVKNKIIVSGDNIGLMYAVYDLFSAEKSHVKLKAGKHTPYIKERGIKINLPLDARTPSYSDYGDSAEWARPYVWDRDYWTKFIDRLSRYKYNLISIWSLMPFPSIVITKGYEKVALNDVYALADKDGAKVSLSGYGFYQKGYAVKKIKDLSIQEKIAFIKDIMEYAFIRGIRVIFYTWNLFTDGIEDDRITCDLDNEYTKEYIKNSVKSLIKTYPLLYGIGITTGENMSNDNDKNERWVKDTYYKGVLEGLNNSDREFYFIHRTQMASVDTVREHFDTKEKIFYFGYKYSYAHMYSTFKPKQAKEFLSSLTDGEKVILTLRNDDMHFLSNWCDIDYAKKYLSGIKKSKSVDGFVMGADNFVPLIDFRDNSEREYYNVHFLRLMLWGECAYSKDFSYKRIIAEIVERLALSSKDAKNIYKICKDLSIVILGYNRALYKGADYRRYPEFNCSLDETALSDGQKKIKFHGVEEYLKGNIINTKKIKKVSLTALKDLNLIKDKRLREDCEITACSGLYLAQMIATVKEYKKCKTPPTNSLNALLESYKRVNGCYKSYLVSGMRFSRFCGLKVDFDELYKMASEEIKELKKR